MTVFVALALLIFVGSSSSVELSVNGSLPHYHVLTIPEEGFVEPNPGHPEKPFTGGFIAIMDAMAKVGNFTYDIQEQQDGQVGDKQADGSWNGIIGALISGSADIALGNIAITKERSEVINSASFIQNVSEWILTNPQADVSTVQYLAENNTLMHLLKSSNESRTKSIWDNIAAGLPASIVDENEALEKVLTGKFAFVSDRETVDILVNKSGGALVRDPVPVSPNVPLSPYAVKLGSPLENFLGTILFVMMTDADFPTVFNQFQNHTFTVADAGVVSFKKGWDGAQ